MQDYFCEMKKEKTIEDYLEMPYWVVDILPKQVPANGEGQYFRIAEYFRMPPRLEAIREKFINVLLKLNCYDDMEVSVDGETWQTNPAPMDMVALMTECLQGKGMLYVILKSADAMITISDDDTYMTVYHPTEALLHLMSALASAEGLFVWKPSTLV